MKSAVLRLALLGFVVFALSAIPAYADGINYGFSSSSLIGLSGASGQFNYNSSTHTLSGATLSLSGSVFGNITVNLGTLTFGKNSNALIFTSTFYNPNTKKTDVLKLLVLLDPKTHNVSSITGAVWDPTGKVGGFYANKFTSVPEEMGWAAYLLDSFVLMGAVLVARRRSQPGRLILSTA